MINLSLYRSVMEAYVHKDDQIRTTFPELVEFFKEQQTLLPVKESGMLFNCCEYREDFSSPNWISSAETRPRNEFIRRCKDNVRSISCLLLDIDGTMTLEQAIEQWANYEFLIYSTHGNSTDKPKFRLVVPLATPLTREEFDCRHTSMTTEFCVDGASFTISQAFYLPSYSAENRSIAFIHWNEVSARYDALNLAAETINYQQHTVVASDLTRSPIAGSLFKTLMSGHSLHYSDALTLAIVCKANGINCSDYEQIVARIAHPDSSLRTTRVSIAGLYKEAYATHVTAKKVESLMTKLNCNMWRWKIAKELK